jgi:hypothetical protein
MASHDFFLNKEQIEPMIEAYRKNPTGGLNPNSRETQPLTQFVHHPVTHLIELLLANQVVSPLDTIEHILFKMKNYGLKIYFAQHVSKEDCPEGNIDFIGRNTVVLVNTTKGEDNLWHDLLEAGEMQAADKGNLCPPQCTLFARSL